MSTISDFGYPLLIDFIIGRIIRTSPILWHSKIKIFLTVILFNEYFLRNRLKNKKYGETKKPTMLDKVRYT